MIWLQLMLSLFWLLNQQLCLKVPQLPLQDCWTAKYDILIILDCRDEISYQYEIYSSLYNYFSSNSLNRISLITYKVNSFRVIKTFNESFSDDHESRIDNDKTECPGEISHLDIDMSTTEALLIGRKEAKKIVFAIILANFRSPLVDKHFVANQDKFQSNHIGIIRIFIIINMDIFFKGVSQFFIFDLKLSKIPLIKYLGTLCNVCSFDQSSFISSDKNYKKCYSLGNSIVKRSMTEAESECKGVFDVIDYNSKEEFNFVRTMVVRKLFKLHNVRAAVLIKAKRANAYTIDPYKDSCKIMLFNYSLQVQILAIPCDLKIDTLKVCEIDLTLYQVFKSRPIVFKLPYKNVKLAETTLVPKKYFHVLLRDNKIYDGNVYHIGKTSYVPINCTVDNNLDFLCQHIVKCHLDENYRRSFCNAPVQYIYKHSLLTEYYNYQLVNISGQNNVSLSRFNETRKNIQPSNNMTSDSIFLLMDYNFSKNVDIVPCKQFDKENLILSEKEKINFKDNFKENLDSHTNVPHCFFSRSVADKCPTFENDLNCSDVVCPANFIKCPESYCVFLGEELRNTNEKCYSLESSERDLSKYFHCSVRLKSTLKRTCFIDDFSDIIKPLYKANVCDFPCHNGFKCIQWHKLIDFNEKKFYTFKIFDKRIDIFNKNVGIFKAQPEFKINPEEIPFLSLLDHAELKAPKCKVSNAYEFLKDLDISQLISLDLSYNMLAQSKDLEVIRTMKLLKYLNLSHNFWFEELIEIHFPLYLESIDLSYTRIPGIHQAAFDKLFYLKYLYLSHTEISNFISIGLKPSFKLKVLDLRNLSLQQINTNYFENLTIQTSLLVSDYKFCCPQITGPRVPQHKCFSPKGPHLSSCEDLIGDSNKRIILWLVGLVAFVSNLLVVVYRLVWDKVTLKKSYGLFVTCLGVSDLIMGLYLLVIAAADSYFRNVYVFNDTKWRYGNVCKFAGFLALFSCESSAFFICLITLDRYLIMRYPFGQHRFSKGSEKCALILTWSVSFILALIPTFPLDWDIYSSNSMCLSLPLNIVTNKGWIYSFCVLILLNFVTFLFIFMGQISVFGWFAKHKFPETSMLSKTRNIELALAKNLAFVVISDFLCWFPIAVMGFISISGYKFGNEAYSWSAVLVIPINSALNPIIYTVPIITRNLAIRRLNCQNF